MPRKKKNGPTSNGTLRADHYGNGEHLDEETEETTSQLGVVEEAFNQLLESRASTRENALQQVRKGLQLHYAPDLVEKWRVTLLEAIMRGLKRGKEAEFKLAAQLLDVVVLTMGTDSEQIYPEIRPSLSVLIMDNTVSPDVRSVAVTSFALLTFVGCKDQDSIQADISLIEEMLSNHFPGVLYAALLQAWSLLLTIMPVQYIKSQTLSKHGKRLVALLDSDEVEVRLASGETLALLFDILRESAEDQEEEFDIYDYNQYLNIDALIDKLKELAFPSGHHISKKEKAKLKSSFKNISRSVESGIVPEETMGVGSTKVDFYSWDRLVQLNFVRQTIGEGTLVHFENNELLQDIFNYSATAVNMPKIQYSKLEKRLYLSANSAAAKNQTIARRRSRQNYGRESKSRIFLSEDDHRDGGDIGCG